MKIALNGPNKISFPDKTFAHPPEDDDQYRLWLRNNNIMEPNNINCQLHAYRS